MSTSSNQLTPWAWTGTVGDVEVRLQRGPDDWRVRLGSPQCFDDHFRRSYTLSGHYDLDQASHAALLLGATVSAAQDAIYAIVAETTDAVEAIEGHSHPEQLSLF